jgi:hypothetical protein
MKYLKNGKAVEVVSVLPDGQGFVVRDYFETFGDVDGEPILELDERVHIVKRVFDEAPTEKIHAEYEAAEKRLQEVINKISEARTELRIVEQERKAVLSKLEQMPALRRLEAWIDGKVTHFVTYNYGRVSVLKKDELKSGDEENRYRRGPEKLKLLTLFGDTEGNLIWEANKYRDGSGSWGLECWMCCSEEEAKKIAAEVIDRELLPDRVYYRDSLIKSADDIGHAIDPKHRVLCNEEKRTELQKAWHSRKEELEKVEKQLLALNSTSSV